MSDISQGPGWWQASDGKWYPPEQAPPGGAAAAPAPGAPPAAGPPPAGPPMGQPPAAQPAYGAPATAAPGNLASWGERAIGYLIDMAILVVAYIALFIVSLVLGAISDALGLLVLFVGYIALAVVGLFFGYLVGQNGASPGMRLTGLKCVSEETGQVIGGGMGIVRSIAHILDSIVCYLGWFLPLMDDKNQTISDKVIKTVVLNDQAKESFSAELFKPQS